MNAAPRPDLRRGGEAKRLLKAETEQIIGFEVINFIRVNPCPSVVSFGCGFAALGALRFCGLASFALFPFVHRFGRGFPR
jgi:hypothetical protein